jgi:protein SCO1/2
MKKDNKFCQCLLLIALVSVNLNARSIEGTIVSVDPAAMQIELNTGLSELGTITASVGRGDAVILKPDSAVRGELVKVADKWRLQTIWPNDPASRGTIANLGQKLRQDTLTRGSKVFRSVGEYLPKFALFDEDGNLFYSESLKGKYAIINFIFTRCASPTMCPAATARMHELKDLAKAEGIEKITLVSITLDPEYDTPGIFTAYAMDKGIETDNFHFLGGPVGIVTDLKTQLGILAEPDEEEIIRHTMSTALVDPTGLIIYRIPGSMWNPSTFLKVLKRDQEKSED